MQALSEFFLLIFGFVQRKLWTIRSLRKGYEKMEAPQYENCCSPTEDSYNLKISEKKTKKEKAFKLKKSVLKALKIFHK